MKQTISQSLLICAFLFSATSCQNDLDVVDQALDNEITINASVDESANTRVQILLRNYEDTYEYAYWNEGDKFTLYDLGEDGCSVSSTTSTFSITEYSNDSLSYNAKFTGACNFSEGNKIRAVYPAQDDAPTDSILSLSVPASISYGLNTDDEVTAVMSSNMYMTAESTMKNRYTNLTFVQLTSMIRVSYQNMSSQSQTISQVKVIGDGEYFGTKIDFNLLDASTELTESTSSISASFDNVSVAAGDTLDIYLLFFPGCDFNDGGSLSIEVDGDQVTYATSALQSTGFSAMGRCWFNLTQTDSGLRQTNNYAVFDDYVLIYSSVNAGLCEALADYYDSITLDDDGNAIIPSSAVERYISIWVMSHSMTSLDGLECFSKIETLNMFYNWGMEELVVPSFQYLDEATIYGNEFVSLDVSQCPALTELECRNNNGLTSINFGDCTSIESLDCRSNNLNSLDVSSLTSLTSLDCYYNNITQLDLSECTNLKSLSCGACELSSLDVSALSNLASLSCQGNRLTTLDISKNSKITSLFCGLQHNVKTGGYQYINVYLTSEQFDAMGTTIKTDLFSEGNYITYTIVSE